MILLGTNNKVLHVFRTCILIFVPFLVTSQTDTTVFQEVIIKGRHLKIDQHTTLNESQIKTLAPNDLGTLLQYINGVTIKNYGGIGGMKTLSHRGLGGEHTQLIIDGLPVSNPQNGQTNLANIQLNNVEEVGLSHQTTNQLIPVSALIKGSSLQLKTFDQQFSRKKFALKSSITVGSFGQKEAFVGIKKSNDNAFISFNGGSRTYEGDYPYKLPFGNQNQEVNRRNNELEDYHFNIGSGIKWRTHLTSHQLKFSGKRNVIQQELPGAVIFYNNLAQETLETENTSAGLNYSLINTKIAFKAFGQYSHRFLHYHDPTYLNSDGFLDNQYTTNSLEGGFHFRYKWKDFIFHLGNDFGYDALKSSRNLGEPERQTNTAMMKLKYNTKYFNIEASGFSQTFIDQNSIQAHRNNYHKFHPQFSFFTSDSLFKGVQFFVWYKPSSRAPSFNELYFSQVGNKELVPEESSQINLGTRYIKTYRKLEIQIQANLFKNRVDNKIIALPTQNLFVWSIQNIGKVDIQGGDIHINAKYKLNRNWRLNMQAGISYQEALDISDSQSPTYRNQIAYTPSITGNAMASLFYKKTGLHFTTLYIGERYSLNENTIGNLLEPYFIMDLSANYAFEFSKKQKLTLHTGVKNLGDTSYNFIKHFVMPGRNYFIKLSYEFN
ncbi:TonB-dependent receptor plug domain-containing protein [Brumimicrobium mesophilum]|uniref:TonB-dependent receptor plug domain-containing protein n=1 Tax=Brumimicrobium mesophilum TaxID=392717 RepID=UPI000D140DF2|nr:TonB-dependent receptor plug domain-containing protein [Brumimicrobium mesophilum]